jgi:hypothetical protein
MKGKGSFKIKRRMVQLLLVIALVIPAVYSCQTVVHCDATTTASGQDGHAGR